MATVKHATAIPPLHSGTCECREMTGLEGCKAPSKWLVRVGTRTSDEQETCSRHLQRTCEAMTGAEMPRLASLTVTRIWR